MKNWSNNLQENANYIAYLLLKNEYLKRYNMDNLSNKELLKVFSKYFPENWKINYSLEQKINMLSIVLKKQYQFNLTEYRKI